MRSQDTVKARGVTKPLSEHRLLVVEDDKAMRNVWKTIFSQRGWDVAVASTVAEGLAMLDPAPHYLILDLSLPDGNGLAILRKVREAQLKTRVAVTTTETDTAQLGMIKEWKPEAIFMKPTDIVGVWSEGEFARAEIGQALEYFI